VVSKMRESPILDLANDSLRSSVGASNAENEASQIFAPAENGPKTIKSVFGPLRPSRLILAWPVL